MYNQPATLDVLECSNTNNNTSTIQPYSAPDSLKRDWESFNDKVKDSLKSEWGSLNDKFKDSLKSEWGSLNDKFKDSLKSEWGSLNDKVKDEYYHTLDKLKEDLTDDTDNSTRGYILVGIFSVIIGILLYFYYNR